MMKKHQVSILGNSEVEQIGGHRVYLGRFRVGKLRLGRFSGGSDDSDVVPDNPLEMIRIAF